MKHFKIIFIVLGIVGCSPCLKQSCLRAGAVPAQCAPQGLAKENRNLIAADLHTTALAMDAYAKDTTVAPGGRINWGVAYALDSYIDLWLLTGESHWLTRFEVVAKAILAERVGPVWPEGRTGHVWIGVTGAMYQPLMRAAAIGLPRADAYIAEFESALAYHEPDYDGRTYRFGHDAPGGLSGTEAPANQTALMAEAVLHYARATASALAQGRVHRYEGYLRAYIKQTRTGSYIWLYSRHLNRSEDIGHGNFVVRYAARAGWAMEPFAAALEPLMQTNGDILVDNLDGTCLYEPRRGAYYWALAAAASPGLAMKFKQHLNRRGNLIELVQLHAVGVVGNNRSRISFANTTGKVVAK